MDIIPRSSLHDRFATRPGATGLFVGCLFAVCLVAAVATARAEEDIRPTFVMDQDPNVQMPPTELKFSEKLKPLWLEALGQPDTDLQRQIAETIALAHKDGMPGLKDLAGPLIKVLEAQDQNPTVRRACARALVELDATEAAPALHQRALRDGTEMSLIVEPTLARWKFEPIRETWLERLTGSQTTSRQLKLAMRGLADAGDSRATEPLRKRAFSRFERADVRLVAAQALGELINAGLESEARPLAAHRSTELERLIAASILRRHSGPEASQLLTELAQDPVPTVAAAALRRLVEIEPSSVAAIAEKLVTNSDGPVRLLTGRALAATATADAIPRLTALLGDADPTNRIEFRQSLIRLAREHPALDGPIREAAMQWVATESGQAAPGIEQAILLLVTLDHKPAAPHLVRLLDHRDYRAFVPAAWGLRQLAVPETLPAMLSKARQAIKRTDMSPDVERQIAFLMEAFGLLDYRDAELVLLECVPKNGYRIGSEARTAAIWSLGHFYAGNPSEELGAALAERLTDVPPMGQPEVERVRVMSAVTIGRMKYAEGLDSLRKYYRGQSGSIVDHACGWAIEQITGEKVNPPQRVQVRVRGFVLEPLDP